MKIGVGLLYTVQMRSMSIGYAAEIEKVRKTNGYATLIHRLKVYLEETRLK